MSALDRKGNIPDRGHCYAPMHSFNPAPGSVPRSNLLGVCPECQAETVIEWHNRARWKRGESVNAVHTAGCPQTALEYPCAFKRMDDTAIRALMKECGL